ncbi:MAG: arginine deiminase-related protein [Steroidobacteraceae bacterium]
MSESQSTHQVLMIRPVRFAGNTATAASNHFQQLSGDHADAQSQALAEFNELVRRLRAASVLVHEVADTLEPHTPDAIFPNNWVSFHDDGTVVLYPMLALNRRLERRMDVLQCLSEQGLRIRQTIDLTTHEADEKFLEGTGSLVLDRVNRIAYACISPRTDLDVLGDFAQRLDYELVTFDAADAGVPIYHTNVLMCVGTRFAVLCSEVIAAHERAAVLHALRSSGHEVIEISAVQMRAFAGNMLELRTEQGELCVAMSQSAFDALTAVQRQKLNELAGTLVVSAIPTIERLGGGSVRCMLAEVFLPRR